ncbi:superinfection exclusion B family protein [Shewanella sp. NIFS-20-20]|uniref:superinfection exclusion B family protein n=1 Tax=Shewanella sp. NIFS-20-20 TaxID=2853806 RepID=UPI001C45D344|nr:superinfection exclusion B family protein [Shewanella sp. NIFS-20-20]MBV7317002.1 superinfection exclusion B family protein [Shewanella sp. NIFS-20-20]
MQKITFKSFKNKGLHTNMVTVMLWLLLASFALLIMPVSLLEWLRLADVVAAYDHFIGLVMLIAAAYFVSQVVSFLMDEAIAFLKDKRLSETIEQKVAVLDLAERALLREFFLQGSTVLTLPMNDMAVKALAASGVLQNVGNEHHYAIHGPTADYRIATKARSYLNRKILRLPAGEPNPEEMQLLLRTRPAFMGQLVQNRKHAA